MGYTKKLVQRDKISGFQFAVDVTDGSYAATALSKRNDARQEQINEAIVNAWPDEGGSIPESKDKSLGDSFGKVKAIANANGADKENK